MKKTFYSIIIAGLALASSACQKVDEKSPANSSADLTVTASIVNFDGTKVSYAFSDPTNAKSAIKPSWEPEDEIFGFDEDGDTFTFTVSSVDSETGKATFNTTNASNLNGTLYAVYYPGDHEFVGTGAEKTLAVDLSSQSGRLDGSTPVIMFATGVIDANNNVNFNFVNQTAIVGIYKMQVFNYGAPVAAGQRVTDVRLKGAVVNGTIQVNDGVLTLEAGTTTADLTANVNFETETDGYVNVDPEAIAPYFAVIPATDASLTIEATCGGNTCSTNAAITGTIAEGKYYYLGKKIYGGTVATIGSIEYKTISEAFAAANDGDIIELQSDCTFDSQITLDGKTGDITLDLNGCTLTNGPTINDKRCRIYLNNEDATLTIRDSNNSGGTITSETADEDVIKVVKGNLVVASGTILAPAATNGGNAAIWVEPATAGATTNASVTVQGAANIQGPANVKTENKRAYALYVENPGAAVTVSGGTFSAQSNSMRIIDANSVDITGGSFVCKTSGEFTLRFAASAGKTCEYNIGFADVESQSCAIYTYGEGVTLNITGGKFKTSSETAAIINAETREGEQKPTIIISSGLFSKSPKPEFVDAFHKIDDNEDAVYLKKVVDQDNDDVTLQIGNGSPRPCGTVEGAVKEANKVSEACVITLNSDLAVTKATEVTNAAGVTIDLNDHTLTYTGSNRIKTTEGCILRMLKGTLTNDGTTNIVYMDKGGTIEMSDVNVTVPSGNYVAVMVNPSEGKTSTFKMDGGFIRAGAASAVNVLSAGISIVVIDGTEIEGNNSNGAFRVESTCSDSRAKVEIKGKTKITSTSYALNLKGNVPCTIYDGNIVSTGGSAISVSSTGALTVIDGEIAAKSASTGNALYLGTGSGKITISGGSFHSTKATINITGSSKHALELSGDCTVISTGSNALYSESTATDPNSTVTVTGGRYSTPNKAIFSVKSTTATKTVYSVSSCIFNGPDPAASRLATGCMIVDNDDPATAAAYPRKVVSQ